MLLYFQLTYSIDINLNSYRKLLNNVHVMLCNVHIEIKAYLYEYNEIII